MIKNWYYPLVFPCGIFSGPTPCSTGDISTVSKILFELEHDGILRHVDEWENAQYRYYCVDCYLACGDRRNVFSTCFEEARNIKDGPSIRQLDQIRSHAKQHEIMWSWVRGLK